MISWRYCGEAFSRLSPKLSRHAAKDWPQGLIKTIGYTTSCYPVRKLLLDDRGYTERS
jgi:hypothetical protein